MALSNTKEFREFFLRLVKENTGTKQDVETGYPVSYIKKGKVVGNRFRNGHEPDEDVFSKLFHSLAFKLNPEDKATTLLQGLIRLATQDDIDNSIDEDENGYSICVIPSQLQTAIEYLEQLSLTSGGNITIGVGDPVNPQESVLYNEIYINTTSWDLFYKDAETTVWVNSGNIKGDQGDPGADGADGENAPQVQIQYSADGSTGWTGTYVEGTHKYIRFSVDGGSTWSTAAKFVGTIDLISETIRIPAAQLGYGDVGGTIVKYHQLIAPDDTCIIQIVDVVTNQANGSNALWNNGNMEVHHGYGINPDQYGTIASADFTSLDSAGTLAPLAVSASERGHAKLTYDDHISTSNVSTNPIGTYVKMTPIDNLYNLDYIEFMVVYRKITYLV